MCTITLTYDENNAEARRKLAALLKTGLFEKQPDQEEALLKEKEEFLYGSTILTAKAFADKL